MNQVDFGGFMGSLPIPPSANLSGSQKLSALADFIAGMPDANYLQSVWGSRGYACGTKGCALGWAGMALADIVGFEFRPIGGFSGNGTWHDVVNGGELIGCSPYGVATKFFGLTDEEAIQLFRGKDVTRCEQVAELRAAAVVLAAREAGVAS